MIPVKFHIFQDGQVPAGKITAERLNKNWDILLGESQRCVGKYPCLGKGFWGLATSRAEG